MVGTSQKSVPESWPLTGEQGIIYLADDFGLCSERYKIGSPCCLDETAAESRGKKGSFTIKNAGLWDDIENNIMG